MIIGISGKIGSGKDTVGEIIQYLVWKSQAEKSSKGLYTIKPFSLIKESISTDLENKHLSGWQVKKFADKLKDIVCLLIGCTREQLEDHEFKNTELGEEWTIKTEMNLTECTNCGETTDTLRIGKLTPRLLLQLIGTECGRNIIHPNIWVNSLFSNYKEVSVLRDSDGNKIFNEKGEHQFNYPNWIITDMRFPNELEAVENKGGISIRVNRNKEDLYLYNDARLTLKELFEVINKDTGEYPLKSYADEHWLIKEHSSETALDDSGFKYVIENNGTIEELIEQVKEILILEKIINENN